MCQVMEQQRCASDVRNVKLIWKTALRRLLEARRRELARPPNLPVCWGAQLLLETCVHMGSFSQMTLLSHIPLFYL